LKRSLYFLIFVAAAQLLAAPGASAVQRFAAPGGPSAGDCTGGMADPPCAITWAVENQAQPGDEVIVASGNYDLAASNLTLSTANVTVHGADDQPPPLILSSSPAFGVAVNNPTALMRRVAVETAGSTAFELIQGRAEQIYAHTTSGADIPACYLALASTLLRDSVCWNSSTDAGTYGLRAFNTGGSATMTLRNVTSIANGPGSSGLVAHAPNTSTDVTIDARNVIASGTAFDVEAAAGNATSVATVNLASSNYATESESGPGMAAVTNPGTPGNQTGAPLFANAAIGDFHQLAGSATIDAGTDDGTLGSLDVEGEPRLQGSAVDIGADETANPAAGGEAADTTPPDTTLTKKPKSKTKRRRATFGFDSSEPGSTFQCSLDDGPFEACASPDTEKVKRGKHSFEVRAIDATGNTDPTPATDDWKVKKKRK
jgi:hypothetical protein